MRSSCSPGTTGNTSKKPTAATRSISPTGLAFRLLSRPRRSPGSGDWKKILIYCSWATDKKLVIVGGSSDTQTYMDTLRSSAGERVVFTGFQQGRALEELYSNACIYVLPSDLEGMPLSLLEAMSYGNCCVVSDIPECADVVGDKAVVFPRGNAGALKNVLQRLLDHPEETNRYKAGASDYICGKYGWDEAVDRTLELYQK